MSTNNITTSDDIRASVSSIYSDLLRKRAIEKEQKAELKRLKEEEKKQEKEEKKEKKSENMTKKERQQASLDTWKEIVVGLTGEDLEYSSERKPRKKYRQWINDDQSTNSVSPTKTKKPKKRNYQKEFAPELNMLKTLVAEQNRFSADLLKRYQNAAGPNTKDAMPPNKTIVELISTINASRANALGMLREIGNLKKTMADLYMKQKKLDADLHGASGVSDADIALMGSDVASSVFGGSAGMPIMPSYNPPAENVSSSSTQVNAYNYTPGDVPSMTASPVQPTQGSSTFDPSSWDGPELEGAAGAVVYETIPHHIVVEWRKDEDKARFKAVRNDNGEELVGAPIPAADPNKLVFNEQDMKVKGVFDEIYPLEIIHKEE